MCCRSRGDLDALITTSFIITALKVVRQRQTCVFVRKQREKRNWLGVSARDRMGKKEGREGGRAGEERNDGEALKDKEKTGGVGGERLTEYVKGGKEKGGRRKEGEKGEEKKSMAI